VADLPAFDVERARAETPGCDGVVHLNNAGASLVPRRVLEVQLDWLRDEAVVGGYELADRREGDRQRTYEAVAGLVGAGSHEIALVENATFAWHQAFWSLPLQRGDRILTCSTAYASDFISFLQAERRRGVHVEVIPDDESGQVSLAGLAQMLDVGGVGLVAITHVPTNGGLVNPAAEVGRLAGEAGVPFLLDACQSVGQLPVDVEELGCDLLSATGRKFLRAPRGTGFLYARDTLLDRLDPAFLDLAGATWVAEDRYELRPDARRFENWEFNMAALAGLGEAAGYAQEWGIPAIAARVTALAEGLRARLGDVPGVTVHDVGERRCGIVTFSQEGIEAPDVRHRLGEQGFSVSVSAASSTLLDFDRRQLPPLVRASVHYYNTDDELDRFAAAVAALA
jgi:cysteine desulfurase / selenocysteine lyase